jgi:hypothetical protein
LGELGYFNDRAGFGGAASDDGDFYGWRLAPEYRGMSVIEALCARSKQRWAEHTQVFFFFFTGLSFILSSGQKY